MTGARRAGPIERTKNKVVRMQHPWSFREHLVFSIGFALTRSRQLLRRLLQEHAPDDAKHELAERVVKHLEQSGFELDEEAGALRKRPPLKPHGMARRSRRLIQRPAPLAGSMPVTTSCY